MVLTLVFIKMYNWANDILVVAHVRDVQPQLMPLLYGLNVVFSGLSMNHINCFTLIANY